MSDRRQGLGQGATESKVAMGWPYRQEDLDERWGRTILDWIPDGRRERGRPVRRWTDAICVYFRKYLGADGGNEYWKAQAQDRDIWNELEQHFVTEGIEAKA